MKKIFSILLFLLLLMLSACTPKTPEITYNIAGKTYYNASDISMSEERSRIWFGSDNSFVLLDNYGTKSDEITGTWKIDNNVIILSKKDNNEEIRFEIKDDHKIILKANLQSCPFDTIFSDDEKLASSDNPSPTISESKRYYNASFNMGESGSYIDINKDKSFTLHEMTKDGFIEVNGLWGLTTDEQYFMFSNFDPFVDANGEKLYNFEFFVFDDDTLLLNKTLATSASGDQFTVSGKLNDKVQTMSGSFFQTTTWIHEPTEQSLPEYYPNFTIYNDLSFVFEENVYAGLAHYKGNCKQFEDGFGCEVADASELQGFAGQDVKYIEFKYDSDGQTLILQTDLCMSMSGDKFFKK